METPDTLETLIGKLEDNQPFQATLQFNDYILTFAAVKAKDSQILVRKKNNSDWVEKCDDAKPADSELASKAG